MPFSIKVMILKMSAAAMFIDKKIYSLNHTQPNTRNCFSTRKKAGELNIEKNKKLNSINVLVSAKRRNWERGGGRERERCLIEA